MSRPRNVTTSVAAALTRMPMLPLSVATMPAVPASQEMVSEKLMATGPKSPGSRQLISPPAAVFARAPAKVLHGEVRLQGFISSAVVMPETHVRVDAACAGAAARSGNATAMMASEGATLRMMAFPRVGQLARSYCGVMSIFGKAGVGHLRPAVA